MGKVKRVRDFMIPLEKFPAIRDNTTLLDAVRVMEEAQLEVDRRKSLPRVLLVHDEIGVFVGYVRRRDIMHGLEPEHLISEPLQYKKKLFDVGVDPNLSELSYDHLINQIKQHTDRPVSDVMHPIETTINADDHLGKAIYEMVTFNVSPIPVLDKGYVVGVIRSVDVFHEIAILLD